MDNKTCCEGCKETGTFTHCWWERKMAELLWIQFGSSPKESNTDFPHDPAILLLGIYPTDMRTQALHKNFTWMFTEALFIIVKK